MSTELSQAVSFATGYFAMADSIVPDLECYLADDVVLDWFGQIIKGRNNVATFITSHYFYSRHIFNEISATSEIEYKKQRPRRRKYYSLDGKQSNVNLFKNDDNEEIFTSNYKRKYYSDEFDSETVNFGNNSPDNTLNMDVEMDFLDYKQKLHNMQEQQTFPEQVSVQDLNIHELKINSGFTSKSECVHSRNLVKLNLDSGEVNNALVDLTKDLPQNMELKNDSISEVEKKIFELRELSKFKPNSIKYMEAVGVIEFIKKFNAKQIRKEVRKRQCKLQIAYSERDGTVNTAIDVIPNKTNSATAFDGVTKINNPNENEEKNHDVNAYKSPDSGIDVEDNVKLFKYLELNASNNDINVNCLVTPKYSMNQSKFDCDNSRKLLQYKNCTDDFSFNYIIHGIIYESNTKCRLNLSHEFESREFSDDLE